MAKSICTDNFKICLMSISACIVLLFQSLIWSTLAVIFTSAIVGSIFLRTTQTIQDDLYLVYSDKKIAFLGWAFKKDTNDTRESAAIYIANNLINEQAKIAVFDPKVSEKQILSDLNYLQTRTNEENKKHIVTFENAYETCKDAHAIAILTEWEEFINYDWQKIYDSMLKPAFVFDGRNILDKNKLKKIGFVYQSIGS